MSKGSIKNSFRRIVYPFFINYRKVIGEYKCKKNDYYMNYRPCWGLSC